VEVLLVGGAVGDRVVMSDGGQVAGLQVGRVADGGVGVDLGAGQDQTCAGGSDEQ
jgi:hypothetical protein